MTGPAVPRPAAPALQEKDATSANVRQDFRHRLTADDIETIRRLISRRMNWFGFGGRLEHHFRLQRSDEFQRTVSEGGPALVFVHVLMNALSFFIRHPNNSADDMQIWLTTLILVSSAIVVGIFTAQVPVLKRSFNILGALCGGLIIFVAMTAAQLYENLDLAQDATYTAMLGMVVTGLGMRLLLPAVTMALIVPTLIALGTGIVTEARIDWLSICSYAGSGITICLYLAYRQELIDRRAFLQSLLLSWESQQLDVANRKLDQLSRRDPLTNLANRRDFNESLHSEWERARRDHTPISLLFIDIDHFKLYNDHYGHAAGDACLVRVSQVLGDALKRPGDLAARYGGEEFVLLLPNTDIQGARRVAERLIRKVDAEQIAHLHSRTANNITISIGVATHIPQHDHLHAQHLLESADAALYSAKNRGRHQYQVAPVHPSTVASKS